MKRFLLIMTMILWATSAQAALRYVDTAAAGAANGTSWTDAWTSIAGITGLSAGDTVYFSGGTSGKTYDTPADWEPASGSAGGGPITYAVGQDAGHTGIVTFARSGATTATTAFLLLNTARYITINGEVNGQRRMTIDPSLWHLCYTTNTSDKHVRILYVNATDTRWFCYGGYYELAYSNLIAPHNNLLDGSFIAHLGEGGTSGWGINSIHHNFIQVWRRQTQGIGQDALKWVTNVDIYNNTLISSFDPAYPFVQHNDGIQTAGSYVRVYNNYFENFISIPIFNEMFGDTTHWRIYNNVIKADEPGVDWNAYRCIEVNFNGIAPPASVVSDYIIANNTCVGFNNSPVKAIHFRRARR